MCLLLDFPGPAHWFVDQTVRRFIIDELLFDRIEFQRPSQLQGDLSDVYNGTGTVTIDFIETKFLPGNDRLGECRYLWFWIRERIDHLQDVWNIRSESTVDLSLRPFNVRYIGILVFSIKNDLASVGICKLDASPRSNGVIVLLR